MGEPGISGRRRLSAATASVQLACAGGHARQPVRYQSVVLERFGLRLPWLAAVSSTDWREHAGRILYRDGTGVRRQKPQCPTAVRRGGGPADLLDPNLGRLPGRRGICRAVDAPLCAGTGAICRRPARASGIMNRAISVVTLVLLAGLGIGATYLVQHTSAARIATEQRLIDGRTLLDMLPPGSYDNQPLEQPLALENVPLTNSTLLGGYWVTLAGQPRAVLLRSQTLGYTSTIELLIAIDANGKLLGVKTLKQAETPGLGGRLADWPNAWLHIFTGKSRTDPADNGWALKKDQGQFDQMAGATTTSRAVINTVHDALRYFDEHRQQLVGSNAHE